MSKHIALPAEITEALITEAEQNTSDSFALKWLQVLSLACAGKSAQECANAAGMSREWVFHQLRRLRKNGFHKSLLRDHGGGCAPAITGEVKAAMIQKLRSGMAATAIRTWLKGKWNIHMSVHGVYYWKRKLASPKTM